MPYRFVLIDTRGDDQLYADAGGLFVAVRQLPDGLLQLYLWRDDRLPDAGDAAAAFAAFVPPERAPRFHERSGGLTRPRLVIWEEQA